MCERWEETEIERKQGKFGDVMNARMFHKKVWAIDLAFIKRGRQREREKNRSDVERERERGILTFPPSSFVPPVPF